MIHCVANLIIDINTVQLTQLMDYFPFPFLSSITLFLWFASPKMISVSKRGSILVTLDWLAKWSVVDIFVLVVTVAGFRVSIQRYVVLNV